jgi:hypothetical protein
MPQVRVLPTSAVYRCVHFAAPCSQRRGRVACAPSTLHDRDGVARVLHPRWQAAPAKGTRGRGLGTQPIGFRPELSPWLTSTFLG